jgi:hypothetical protein
MTIGNIASVLARRIQRGIIRSLFRGATHRLIQGLPVRLVTGSFEAEAAYDRIASGLALLACYHPPILARLRRDAQGILVWETESSSALAAWHFGVKLIIVDARLLFDRETTPAKIAATLAHEATHRRLDQFGYPPEKRARIEALCFRRERAFARRLPDSHELVAEIERQLQRDPSYWADDAHAQRVVDELAKRGVPGWLIQTIRRLSGRRAA